MFTIYDLGPHITLFLPENAEFQLTLFPMGYFGSPIPHGGGGKIAHPLIKSSLITYIPPNLPTMQNNYCTFEFYIKVRYDVIIFADVSIFPVPVGIFPANSFGNTFFIEMLIKYELLVGQQSLTPHCLANELNFQ